MNLISRMLSGLLVVSTLLVTFLSLSSEWLLELGLVTARLNGNRISLHELQNKNQQLARETQVSVKRLYIKEKIAEALKDGQMTLIDAATCFRSLHANSRSWHDIYHPRPRFEDGEAWCREVIDWTEEYFVPRHSHSQIETLHQRLEAELQQRLKCQGGIRLPE